jgi:mRNA-degrading endonuclease RelE of RelBE toxin-antitoxin system
LGASLNKITFRASALEELESLPRPIQELVAVVIGLLERSDLPKGAIEMRERPDLRRIYVGRKHRLIYSVPRKGHIEILRIRARPAAYLNLGQIDLD